MSKLYMLAGGIVEAAGGGGGGRVSAFVAFNPKPAVSRLFKVHGLASEPTVTELPSATTVDLHAFRRELEEELAPALAEIAARGGSGAIAAPRAEWIADVVRAHLESTEGGQVK